MSKKIGILSMQRVINYGSYLQAYELKKLLLENGASEVEFIDIVPGQALKGYEISGFRYKVKRLTRLARVIFECRLFAKKRTASFMKQVEDKIKDAWPALGINSSRQEPTEYDVAVIGSDEVFNCCQSTSWGFTSQLYGDIPQAGTVVSYAGSFGRTTLELIEHHGIGNKIAAELNKMMYISVRDANSRKIVKALTGKEPLVHIDPVLAYGFRNELETLPCVKESGYILVYSYPDRINDKKEIAAIKSFAKSTGKKLISVMSRYDWCDDAVIPAPLELLAWFKGADYVISETFHGTIFSIIAQKQFVTFGRSTSIAKLTSMLEPYGLAGRLLTVPEDIPDVFGEHIDYNDVNSRLENLRSETVDYIKLILNA